MYKNKASLLALSLLFIAQLTNAQSNNTNSPYTRFGYGEISDSHSADQRAMGGVAIGAHSNRSINTINPASYCNVDSMTFMFDIGVSPLISRFSNESGTKTTFNANLEYITMQFPLGKKLGFSAGLLPYSFVGYNFYKNDTLFTGIKDFDSIPNRPNYWGKGGFSQVYAGLSAKLSKHLAVGVNAYYMYGTVYNNKSICLTNILDSTVESNYVTANNLRFRFGVQYYNTFAQKHDVSVGLIYEPKVNMNGEFLQTTYGVLNDTTISKSGDSNYEIPTMYGVGLYYTYDKRLSVGLDYSMQEWSKAKLRGSYDLLNRSKLALGIEYLPNPRSRKFSQRVRYRAGANISDSYYSVNGATQPKNYGLSLGFGLPLYNNGTITMLNTSFEYGKIGTASLLREDYFRFTLNVAFNEHWFFKRKL